MYLNKTAIDEKQLLLPVIEQEVADFLVTFPEVYLALTAHDLQTQNYEDGLRKIIQNGYYPERSGDILVSYTSGTTIQPDSKIAVENVKGPVHGSGSGHLIQAWNSTPGLSKRASFESLRQQLHYCNNQ